MFVVTVVFSVEKERLGDFLPLMKENAQRSLEVEPGCQRFDVCQHAEHSTEVFLYEIYDDADAFEAHLTTPHFRAFSEASDAMVTSKTVRTYTLLG